VQTFSYVQRDSNDERALVFFVGLLLFFYEPLTTLIFWLPPLLGVAVWMILSGKFWLKVIWFGYLFYFEIDHSFPPLTILMTLFFVKAALERIKTFFYLLKSPKWLLVFLFYLILALLLLLFTLIIDMPLQMSFWRYLFIAFFLDIVFVYAL